jgi:hypothetical protein
MVAVVEEAVLYQTRYQAAAAEVAQPQLEL